MKRIETTSSLYLKRMARELNSAGILNGFYAHETVDNEGTRCNRARFRNGTLEVREIGEDAWFKPASDVFVDCYGRTIHANTVA